MINMSDISAIIGTNYVVSSYIIILFQHTLFSGQMRYLNIRPWTSSYLMHCNVDMHSGAGGLWSGNQLLRGKVMQPYGFPRYFKIGPRFSSRFLCSDFLYGASRTHADKSLLLHSYHEFLPQLIRHFNTAFFQTLSNLDNYKYQSRNYYEILLARSKTSHDTTHCKAVCWIEIPSFDIVKTLTSEQECTLVFFFEYRDWK